MSSRGVAGFLLALALATQITSATFWVGGFGTPNPSEEVAASIARRGTYTADNWPRLHGPGAPTAEGPIRAFVLPGEPLYLAAAFTVLPESLWPYLHVPITALLIASVGVLGCILGGPRLGLASGLVANFQPFVVLHGPVWDDIFLSTALDTALVAALATWAGSPGRFRMRPAPAILLALAAGFSAVTRTQSRATLGLLALVILALPSLRRIRPAAVAILAGIALAVLSWGARNEIVLGHFETGSTHDGITLWESNYPSAWESVATLGQVEALDHERMGADYAETRAMGEIAANGYFKRRAMRHMLEHPVDVLWTGVRKAGVTLSGWAPEYPPLSPRNLVAFASNAVLLVLATVGARYLRPREWTPAVTLIVTYGAISLAATAGMLLIGPVGLRYRMGAEWVLWTAAGAALVRLYGRVVG